MSEKNYVLGLDYGTNSVRCLIVEALSSREIASAVSEYQHGDQGIILDPNNPDLARQHPEDYLTGAAESIQQALSIASDSSKEFSPNLIAGMGIDATGSTPMPVDTEGQTLAANPKFANNPAAMAWLWKDHTSSQEARELTEAAKIEKPEYLEKCGGTYSSEWFWSKLWHCIKTDPEVIQAAHSWIEISDWIPAVFTGNCENPVRNICAAGHKALYHEDWNGYPDTQFLAARHPELSRIRSSLDKSQVQSIQSPAGLLSEEWATQLGLRKGIPVATGALDAHMGAVGSGICTGTMVKIMGTSTCDIIVAPLNQKVPFIPGLSGMVSESVLPGHHGLEAGQSAVGDLFGWWVDTILKNTNHTHSSLTKQSEQLKPGESGLLALDWNNGNRCLLCDPQLTGLILGQTLQTKPEEIYRALMEATAFGARMILEQMSHHGVQVDKVIACGGLAVKNPMLMQIYADVTRCEIYVSDSTQACALGSTVAASVVSGIYPDIPTAQQHMISSPSTVRKPDLQAAEIYDSLFSLYKKLHDSFGKPSNHPVHLADVMKELLNIRQTARS